MLKKYLSIAIILIVANLFMANFAYAVVDFYGGQKSVIEATLGLSTKDPRVIIAGVIRVALGFLGIIALGLIMYAGFIWMTSGGDENKIDKAKQILKNAVIGLLIILSSFAITSFLFNKFLESHSGAGGGTNVPGGGGGIGALGACAIENVYPEPGQKEVPRNLGAIMVRFAQEVKPETICDDSDHNGQCNNEYIIPDRFRLFKVSSGDGCANGDCSKNTTKVKAINSPDKKTFVFTPDEWLGSPSEYIWYAVYLPNDIEKFDGKPVFANCKSDYFLWQFEVSNKLDLEPPQVESVFPAPDNEADEIVSISGAVQAQGSIKVSAQPQVYAAAHLTGAVSPGNVSFPAATAAADEHCGESGDFTVTVQPDGVTAQLSKGGALKGSAVFSGNSVVFNNYFTLTVASAAQAGNFWTLNIAGETNADTLTAGNKVYKFVAGAPATNQIQKGAAINATAANIADVLDARTDLIASAAGDTVDVKAEVAGAAGNNLALLSSNSAALQIAPLAGGSDNQTRLVKKDKKDKPKNSAIQINFNEAVNPLTVSGSADDLKNYIKIVNAKPGAAPENGACAADADCLSFKCDNSLCVGSNDYLEGKFIISNQFKTVEFLSNNICGINGCGENIYCLPGSSHLKVELIAAGLDGCVNCASKAPYKDCVDGHCRDVAANKYYPLAQTPLAGIADTAFNSLDGNRDGDADGPAAGNYYNENAPNAADGDNYQWSFFISDLADLTPPIISALKQKDADNADKPLTQGTTGAHLSNPVLIEFSKIMLSSSLTTGSKIINNGREDVKHQLINLLSANQPVGYWVVKDDVDSSAPLDGEADWTRGVLNHGMFSDATTYKAQAGSGVKDIYQNCFKPSTGPGCAGGPSCCNGAANAGSSCP